MIDPQVLSYWLRANNVDCEIGPDPCSSCIVVQSGIINSWGIDCGPEPSDAELAAFAASPEYEALRKADAIATKTEEIHREAEIRSVTYYGEEVSRYRFAEVEELYVSVLNPSARNAIDEQTTPVHWGHWTMHTDKVAALSALNSYAANHTSTEIMAFDVASWPGWTIPRPE